MPRLSNRAYRAAGYAAVTFLLVVLVGIYGSGPFGFLRKPTKSSSNHDPTAGDGASGVTSTTGVTLEMGDYRVGDCVFWDEDPSGSARLTVVVPCTAPHRIEISGRLDVTGRFPTVPTDAQLQQVITHDCEPSVQKLLGRPLDPAGRFSVGGITPTRESWDNGSRTIWCGAELTPEHQNLAAAGPAPFTGKVEGASQTRTATVGACYTTSSAYAVPCSAPHRYEVTGHIDLGANTKQPANDAAWQQLAGARCELVGRAYLGRDVRGDEGLGWISITPASWAAGRRVVDCTVARYAKDNTELEITGSLKS